MVRCCTEENWDKWQRPTHDEDETEYTEQQTEVYEPHCDDPDFIVCTLSASIYQLIISESCFFHRIPLISTRNRLIRRQMCENPCRNCLCFDRSRMYDLILFEIPPLCPYI